MDIVQQRLSLAPVPYLELAFSVFRFIWSSVEQAQASKQQLRALASDRPASINTQQGVPRRATGTGQEFDAYR